jgi:hypothetical protein
MSEITAMSVLGIDSGSYWASRVSGTPCDDGAIRLRLNVRNNTRLAIRRVLFPRVPWTPMIGIEADDDRLLSPFNDGQLISAPGRGDRFSKADYPGMAPVQLAAYYDRQAGSCLAAEDAGGNPKRFQCDAVAGHHVAVNLVHLFEESPGNDNAMTGGHAFPVLSVRPICATGRARLS